MHISHETLADNRAFCQRRYDRATKKANLLEGFAKQAEDEEIFDLAAQLQGQADRLRKSVNNAARSVSERHEHILREFAPRLEG